jgi:hypothetical protein
MADRSTVLKRAPAGESRAPASPPLALKGANCAAALDISLSTFNALVDEGKMPRPIPIPGHVGLVLYDWKAISDAWAAIVEAGDTSSSNPFD